MDNLWHMARDAPRTLAAQRGEFILQMLDEFQFLNAMIFRDEQCKIPANTIAGGYLSSAESKIAPL
ncbi:MAG: hypothetical protein GY757_07195 [bacterium]|nr:hypothetical protein [bacterium]